ncbi:MAG: hypothetical protein LBH10_04715, partial [Burkholderiaceae bacterium]|nr:hypothetical protein [Burkholderiaceae bacterium]
MSADPAASLVNSGLRQRLTRRLAHLPRETRDTGFLLTVIAWITLPLASSIPPWATLLTAAALLWRGWLAWTGRPL